MHLGTRLSSSFGRHRVGVQACPVIRAWVPAFSSAACKRPLFPSPRATRRREPRQGYALFFSQRPSPQRAQRPGYWDGARGPGKRGQCMAEFTRVMSNHALVSDRTTGIAAEGEGWWKPGNLDWSDSSRQRGGTRTRTMITTAFWPSASLHCMQY